MRRNERKEGRASWKGDTHAMSWGRRGSENEKTPYRWGWWLRQKENLSKKVGGSEKREKIQSEKQKKRRGGRLEMVSHRRIQEWFLPPFVYRWEAGWTHLQCLVVLPKDEKKQKKMPKIQKKKKKKRESSPQTAHHRRYFHDQYKTIVLFLHLLTLQVRLQELHTSNEYEID